jgi:hypothetical protein
LLSYTDEQSTPPRHARLPALHAGALQGVLGKLAAYPRRLADLRDDYFSTQHWNEKLAQDDGTIHRRTSGDNGFVTDTSDWVLSGPHFFLANPFNKTPRRVCTANGHYDQIDLEVIPDDYLPRTNYVPACDPVTYHNRTPTVSWDDRPVTEFYRTVHRRQLSQSGERTFVPTIIPTNAGHINAVISTAFRNSNLMIDYVASCISLVSDFFVKTTGRGDLYAGSVGQFPLFESNLRLSLRVLILTCLTSHYGRPLVAMLGPHLQ